MLLRNKYDKKLLQELLMAENFHRTTLSFYRYVILNDVPSMRDRLYAALDHLKVFGRIYVANEGIFITVVKSEIADQVLEVLKTSDAGINAAIIGAVTPEHPKQVILTSSIGGRRMLNMLTGEQLPRIC